ncbi:MAG: ribosome silencing factor [Lachnospiraceae bacterium]|uniref:Ribosomal silencing factor RsfS n=1 Tax=Candidatus Weimeria bifida TaxID=2599074 RepID=A0A6N7J0Z9_9FIRM|nr:ribosome silencing factor [Candidatus Weimeria bifida]RRF96988.1 MAG: ribosome silencing factor [Lachnospiraceae bacterium]
MANTLDIAKFIKKTLEEKKGENIDIIDISNVSIIADYFVVASASNLTQLEAMKKDLEEKLYREYQMDPKDVEGRRSSTWVLLDYGDIVIHLFTREARDFYNLERIWKDGKMIEA